MATDQERRRHPRAKAKWSVTLETAQGVINTETLDISLEGAFVRCLDPLKPEEPFKMVVNIPCQARIPDEYKDLTDKLEWCILMSTRKRCS